MPPTTPSTTMSCTIPRPVIDMTVSNSSSPGNDIQASTNLCTTRSSLPPMNPEVPPIQPCHDNVEGGRRKPHEYRDARPVNEAAQHVAAQVVGTQEMNGRRALQDV